MGRFRHDWRRCPVSTGWLIDQRLKNGVFESGLLWAHVNIGGVCLCPWSALIAGFEYFFRRGALE